MHNDFTLFTRTYPNGTSVVFYYAYDEDGVRRGPWTTKCRGMTMARKYCHQLIKKDLLIPNCNRKMTFAEFAEGFWERSSEYIENQDGRADITDTYIDNCKKMLKNQILPFFGDKRLRGITSKDVNNWLLGFKKREVEVDGEKQIKAYKNTYANTVFGTLHTMMAQAVEKELIDANPCAKVKKLKDDSKTVEILTVDEVHRLFPKRYKGIWGGKEIAYAANRLASITGMRVGEILGLRGEYVYDKDIYVCGQYTEKGYQDHTKTKENRYIPICNEVMAMLRGLVGKNGKGYLFSLDGGAKPVSTTYVSREFKRALVRIGVSKEEIKRRNLSMHGWRHFLNTDLQRQGLTVQQVQSVTGHKAKRSTERYSHLDARLIGDIVEAQAVICGGGKKKAKPGEAKKLKAQKASKPVLMLVKKPVREQMPERKHA